eukprot:scaffold34263_cov74-Cyclotella_meneghiniana.AAC.1
MARFFVQSRTEPGWSIINTEFTIEYFRVGQERVIVEYNVEFEGSRKHVQVNDISTIPPPFQTRVVDCLVVLEETEFVFGRVGDGGVKSAEAEAAMTPPGEMALTLEVHDDVGGSGRDKL